MERDGDGLHYPWEDRPSSPTWVHVAGRRPIRGRCMGYAVSEIASGTEDSKVLLSCDEEIILFDVADGTCMGSVGELPFSSGGGAACLGLWCVVRLPRSLWDPKPLLLHFPGRRVCLAARASARPSRIPLGKRAGGLARQHLASGPPSSPRGGGQRHRGDRYQACRQGVSGVRWYTRLHAPRSPPRMNSELGWVADPRSSQGPMAPALALV